MNQIVERPRSANPPVQPLARSPGADFRVEFFDPLRQSADWDRLIELHPDSNVFHRAGWARVLNRSYSHEPLYFAAFDGERPLAAMPLMEVKSPLTGKRGVSLPFSDFCPPLLFSDSVSEALLVPLLELGRTRGWKSLLVRGFHGNGELPQDGGASCYLHSIDLTATEGQLLERCSSSVRRAIRRAQHEGIGVEQETSRQALLTFYDLHSRTRRRHGLPPQPWKFFQAIGDEFMARGDGCILSAKKGSRTIAAAVFLTLKDKVLYKFAASDFTFQNLRPNNLVLWEAIRFYAAQGARTLHLGRTDLHDRGLRRFKLGWGSREVLLPYRRYDFSQQRWSVEAAAKGGPHQAIFRRMPLSVNRFAGAAIYPHLD